jgi:hypothetical protein
MKGYDIHKAAVKEALQGAVSKIHIAFDLWTSSNCLSLNGIVAHFIDAKFESRAILLATPEQNESHMGVEIADQVISVIEDFNIGDNLGFFVLDNASNNDTAMQAIGNRFGFDPQERRLRCAGHVINLIARHLLFGFDKNLFELEESLPVNLKEELKPVMPVDWTGLDQGVDPDPPPSQAVESMDLRSPVHGDPVHEAVIVGGGPTGVVLKSLYSLIVTIAIIVQYYLFYLIFFLLLLLLCSVLLLVDRWIAGE